MVENRLWRGLCHGLLPALALWAALICAAALALGAGELARPAGAFALAALPVWSAQTALVMRRAND